MPDRIDPQTEEFARQYVLGTLPSNQAREFESKLQKNDVLAAFVHDIAQVSATLAKTLVRTDAPDGLGNSDIQPEADSTAVPPISPESIGQGRFWFMLNSGQQNWRALPTRGCSIQDLEVSDRYAVMLLHMKPGTHCPAHRHAGAEETYVLSGEVTVAGQTIREGDFHHADPGSVHSESVTTEGCLLLLVASPQDHALHWCESPNLRISLAASTSDPSPH